MRTNTLLKGTRTVLKPLLASRYLVNSDTPKIHHYKSLFGVASGGDLMLAANTNTLITEVDDYSLEAADPVVMKLLVCSGIEHIFFFEYTTFYHSLDCVDGRELFFTSELSMNEMGKKLDKFSDHFEEF